MGGTTPGDIVADRLRQRGKLLGIHTEHMQQRYVLERTVYRLDQAFGAQMMLKGSLAALVSHPAVARHAPDADIHLKDSVEDLDLIIPDLLTRTYYDSSSPTGLLEDHVRFTRFKAYPSAHSGGGVKLKIEAMLGGTRVNTSIDIGFGHGAVAAYEVREFPSLFRGLPAARVLCQPEANRMADKIRAGLEFGLDNTRVKDLFDIAASIHAGRFDAAEVGRALWLACKERGVALEAAPECVGEGYGVLHQGTWETWLEKARIRDTRTLAEVCQAIRRPVREACRQALRLEHRAQVRPSLRLVG